jgi:hypothetical protein
MVEQPARGALDGELIFRKLLFTAGAIHGQIVARKQLRPNLAFG